MGNHCCSQREAKPIESPFELNLNNYSTEFRYCYIDQINQFYLTRKHEVKSLSLSIIQANTCYKAFIEATGISLLQRASLETTVKVFVWIIAATSSITYQKSSPYVDVPCVTSDIARVVESWTAFITVLEALPGRLTELNEKLRAAAAKAEAEHSGLVTARSLTEERTAAELLILQENLDALEEVCVQLQRDASSHLMKLRTIKRALKQCCTDPRVKTVADEATRLNLSKPKEVVRYFFVDKEEFE